MNIYNYLIIVSKKISLFIVGVAKRVSPPRIGPSRAWSAKMRVGLARPAKLLCVTICGPTRVLFFKLNIFFFTFCF